MKIKSVIPVGRHKVYDVSVKDAEHYILQNGVVTHNTGVTYSSNAVWIIGRRQDKEGDDIVGYNFIINIDKSRSVKEKSKIPITVSFEGGISKWSGLIDMAIEHGSVIKPKAGWYTRVITDSDGVVKEDKNYRLADTFNEEFWTPIFKETEFESWAHQKYAVAVNSFMKEEDDN